MLKSLIKIVNIAAAGYVIFLAGSIIYQVGYNARAREESSAPEKIEQDGYVYVRVD